MTRLSPVIVVVALSAVTAATARAGEPPPKVDLLVVVDNSGSMAEEQLRLALDFERLITTLELAEGGLPDLHVGVVSSDVGAGPNDIVGCVGEGDRGVLKNAATTPGCAPPDGPFIADTVAEDGSRERNYTGTLADTFACIAQIGVDGCGFERPLEAVRLALDGSNLENAGFLRDDAALAVLFVTDEDDCSAEDTDLYTTDGDGPLGPLSSFRCTEFGIVCGDPPEPITREPASYVGCVPRSDSYVRHPLEYVDFLRALKADPTRIVVAVIAGPPEPVVVGRDDDDNARLEPSCAGEVGEAAPAVRFRYVLDQFPDRNHFASICAEDSGAPYVALAELIQAAATGAPVDPIDAGPGAADAGADAADAGPDAPADAGPDSADAGGGGGDGDGDDGGGCGCRTAAPRGTNTPAPIATLLLLALAWLKRGRSHFPTSRKLGDRAARKSANGDGPLF
jgi:hypothetical protein